MLQLTTIKNLASAALVNERFVDGDNIVIWRLSTTGQVFMRIAPGVDVEIVIPGGMVIVGGLDPAGGGGNIDYPAALVGQSWFFTSAGTIGNPGGEVVEVGDLLICLTDSAGGDQAAAGADFQIQQLNMVQATELQEGFSRFSDGAEISAGVLANVGTSPFRLIELLGTTGLVNLRTLLLEPNTETDPLITKTFDRTVPGANAQGASYGAGAGAADAAAGGDGGNSNLDAGDGADSTAAAGVGGEGGNSNVVAGDGGADAEGSAGTGGDGGDVVLNPGVGGAGDTPGNNGFVRNEGQVKDTSQTALIAKVGGGQDVLLKLTEDLSKVDTVATPGDSITLPAAFVGMTMTVVNDAAVNSLDLFPFTANTIDGLAVNIAIAVASDSFSKLHCFVDGAWTLI